jgi:hypothetical protein
MHHCRFDQDQLELLRLDIGKLLLQIGEPFVFSLLNSHDARASCQRAWRKNTVVSVRAVASISSTGCCISLRILDAFIFSRYLLAHHSDPVLLARSPTTIITTR